MIEAPPSIPGYEILGVLGSGATATVYEAREKNLERRVALKVFSDEAQGKEEFDALSRCVSIDSPHITRVYRAGVEGGHAFVEMELLSGRSLLGWIRAEGRLSPARAVTTMRGVLDGLAALHGAGLVHRDVKPANIFIAETDGGPVAKLGDFGLVRSEEGPPTLLRGTPGYVPPEAGVALRLQRASASQDVYAAGAVLYCCLTGQEPDRFWSLHLRGAPSILRQVIRRALSEDPDRRFIDVKEMKEALQRWPGRPSVLRRPSVLAGMAASALVLGAGLTAWAPWGELPARLGLAAAPATAAEGPGEGAGAPARVTSGVIIEEPTGDEAYVTASPSLFLAGTATGPRKITKVTWSNAANNSSGIATGTDSWSVMISLLTGENPIVVKAYDEEGLAGTSSIRVYNGGVWACGHNAWGQSGGAAKGGSARVSYIEGLGETSKVDAGANHTLALLRDGTVRSWGRNTHGQLGRGTFADSPTPEEVRDLQDVSQVSAGASHSLALLEDGTVKAWGLNDRGQLGDGTLINRPRPVKVVGLSGVKAVAAGLRHSVALLEDGTVRAWGAGIKRRGLNSRGDTGLAPPVLIPDPSHPSGVLHGVAAISAKSDHTLALLEDGTLRAWGNNVWGQLGNGATSASTDSPVTVLDSSEPPSVLRGVFAIASGGHHSLALLQDGTVRAWGANDLGQLGDGTTTSRATPVVVVDPADPKEILTGVTAIATGARAGHSVALLGDGSVRSWGGNQYGQLGDGTMTDRLSPVTVFDATDPSGILIYIRGIAVGAAHTIVYK